MMRLTPLGVPHSSKRTGFLSLGASGISARNSSGTDLGVGIMSLALNMSVLAPTVSRLASEAVGAWFWTLLSYRLTLSVTQCQ
jgi:hypothetical protein